MRLSLFRSKSNTPSPSLSSPKKPNRFAHMLSPTRTKHEDPDSQTSPQHTPGEDSSPLPAAANGPTAALPQQTASDPQLPNAPASDLGDVATRTDDGVPSSSYTPEPSSNADGDQSILDERAMTRKLMDVESSFLPDPVPVANGDDEAVGSAEIPERKPSQSKSYSPQPYTIAQSLLSDRTYSRPSRSTEADSQQSLTSVSERYQPSRTQPRTYLSSTQTLQEEEPDSYEDGSFVRSSQRYAASSPSVAVAERNKLRASSNQLRTTNGTAKPRLAGRKLGTEDERVPGERAARNTLRTGETRMPTSGSAASYVGSSVRNMTALERLNQDSYSPSKRPEYLEKRQSAQRASKDSFVSQASENTIGPGYDGQSGDATPGTTVRESRELSRIPSLGSVASSISAGTRAVTMRSQKTEPGTASVPNNLEALRPVMDEEVNDDVDFPDQLETPRAASRSVTAPSNTELAQRVRNVEVPDTVAREYRATHLPGNAAKQSLFSTPSYDRTTKDVTLKEQSDVAEKLSKENFNLKLKIHFLEQRIEERSDDNVKDLISHNAQLQADVVNLRRENKELRKKSRNLERRQQGIENASASLHHSIEESEDDSSRTNTRVQLEEEVLYLREQMEILQDDNARLLQSGQPEWSTLDKETMRRKQAEREVRELQQQLEQFRGNGNRLRIRHSNANLNHSETGLTSEDRDGASLSGNTLVDQLRHENATLRRDLGAQTDMLSSRNRERERLQQEIEDLKLFQRRGDQASSAAGDSILDRSVSRQQQQRSVSRASGATPDSQLSDQDRNRLEGTHAGLRDENASLRMRNQDLQRELSSLGEGAEHIRTLQKEKDDATQALRDADGDIDYLYDQMNQLEELVLQKEQDIEALENELRDREDESAAFRTELKSLTGSFNTLADDSEANQVTIQSLRQDVANANGELEAMESDLREVKSAKERLEVQQESAEGEIAFLREEQEADKLKIGDLQSSLRSAKASLQSEESKLREFEELETQASKAREEARELRHALSAKENEHAALQDDFSGLHATFDKAAWDFEEAKAGLQEELNELKSHVEQRQRELDQSKLDQDSKDRLLRDRDGLLESSGHENRRLADLLDKERQGRRHDRNEHERTIRNARGTTEGRVLELESANNQHKKKVAELENKLRDQLDSRDALFLSLWKRLSDLCTSEKLMEAEEVPQTVRSISGDIAAFEEHISTVIEAIETHVGGFRGHLLDTEKAVSSGFKNLQQSLGERQTRIDALELEMREFMNTQSERASEYAATAEYLARLKHENKLLKRELRFLKQGSFALPGLPSPVAEARDRTGARDYDYAETASIASSSSQGKHRYSAGRGGSMLLRTHSAGPSDGLSQAASDPRQHSPEPHPPKRSASSLATLRDMEPTPATAVSVQHIGEAVKPQQQPQAPSSASEQRWIMKLEALKRSLHQEREGRLLDRSGARKRLEEGKRQSEALKEELARERLKREAAQVAEKGVGTDVAGSGSGT